jgi:hypothetical protein
MVMCPGVGGGEGGVFISGRGTCWRGGVGVRVVAELRIKWDGGCRGCVEVDENETLGCDVDVNFKQRVL